MKVLNFLWNSPFKLCLNIWNIYIWFWNTNLYANPDPNHKYLNIWIYTNIMIWINIRVGTLSPLPTLPLLLGRSTWTVIHHVAQLVDTSLATWWCTWKRQEFLYQVRIYTYHRGKNWSRCKLRDIQGWEVSCQIRWLHAVSNLYYIYCVGINIDLNLDPDLDLG